MCKLIRYSSVSNDWVSVMFKCAGEIHAKNWRYIDCLFYGVHVILECEDLIVPLHSKKRYFNNLWIKHISFGRYENICVVLFAKGFYLLTNNKTSKASKEVSYHPSNKSNYLLLVKCRLQNLIAHLLFINLLISYCNSVISFV